MTFIDSWDSGQPNAFWDVGLDWDTNVGPNPGDITRWLSLITSEHNQRPNYMAMVSAVLQPFADTLAVVAGVPLLYDVDTAIGSQLDIDGQWVGETRFITVPLTDVFFSWDVAGLGWGEGNWTASINATELVTLPDAQFRTLIFAAIAANHWNGTIPQAYDIWNTIFAGTGIGILIQDLPGMHMDLALTGPVPDAVTKALFTGGYLNLVPAGVKIDHYYTPFLPDVPYFGWGVENASISGWDVGYWGVVN
jgi:hypothetical protein